MNEYDLGDVKVSVTFDLGGQDFEEEHCCHCEGCFEVVEENFLNFLDGLEPEPLITLELTPEEVARIAQLTALVAGDDACYSLGMKVDEYVDEEYMLELINDVEASFSMSGGVVLKV